jgi:hypothetical protein
MIFRKVPNKYYLIGLHLGTDMKKNCKAAILFSSDLKAKFSEIFLKRDLSIN